MNTNVGTPDRLDQERLAQKVAWEGGAFEAPRYRIRSTEIGDPELAILRHEMEDLYERIAPLARKIDRVLHAA